MKQIAAANFQCFFEVSNDFLEPIGVEWPGIEEEKSELANDAARGVTGEDGVGVSRLQDLRGVVGEDEVEQAGETDKVVGVTAEKGRGAFRPGKLPGGWIGGEPLPFAEDGQDIAGGVGV